MYSLSFSPRRTFEAVWGADLEVLALNNRKIKKSKLKTPRFPDLEREYDMISEKSWWHVGKVEMEKTEEEKVEAKLDEECNASFTSDLDEDKECNASSTSEFEV